jgi:hypothetical protein
VSWPARHRRDPVDTATRADIEAELIALDIAFGRRARLMSEAEADGLLDYLTCPACRALVPIGTAGTWPDTCPRCGRCVDC